MNELFNISGIHRDRIQQLNEHPVNPEGQYVLYWMQASQRTEDNHALEYAIRQANYLGKPVVVYFGLFSNYPEANTRHYQFMLEGLQDVRRELESRGIRFVIQPTDFACGIIRCAEKASLLVTDRGYTRFQRNWRSLVAVGVSCACIQVETDVIVPVETVSDKREYAARTLRPKLQFWLDTFLKPIQKTSLEIAADSLQFESMDISDIDNALKQLNLDNSVPPVEGMTGGTAAANARLEEFLSSKLARYNQDRNDPALCMTSGLSPYLHFGHISPVTIALRANKYDGENVESFLEELIIRRELSMNFVYFDPNYDSLKCLPNWAQSTLKEHADDPRDYIYSRDVWEQAQTHDKYWNAAQRELVLTGEMQGYMRMYWGKKILEWSATPEEAFQTALYLNNRYALDGRDPNSYAGIAWCFGNHDQAWKERPVYGKVRYMNANGLRRKFDIDKYVERIDTLANNFR